MKRSRKSEIIVGLFVLVALAALLSMTYLIRGSTGRNPYTVRAAFPNVAGLEIGSPVLVSGFRTGRVVSMEPYIDEDKRQLVMVVSSVARTIPIYEDGAVSLVSMGFIGDKRLEVDPGTHGGKEIGDEFVMKGIPPTDFNEIFDEAKGIVADLSVTVKKAREFATDDERMKQLADTITNINKTSEEVRLTVEENRAQVKQAIEQVNKLTADGKDITAQSKRILADAEARIKTLGDQVDGAVTDFRKNSKEVSALLEKISTRADTLGANADDVLVSSKAELKRISDNFDRTSANVNEILESINSGKGTVGKLVNDPRPFEDLQASIAALRKLLFEETDGFYDRRLDYRTSGEKPAGKP